MFKIGGYMGKGMGAGMGLPSTNILSKVRQQFKKLPKIGGSKTAASSVDKVDKTLGGMGNG